MSFIQERNQERNTVSNNGWEEVLVKQLHRAFAFIFQAALANLMLHYLTLCHYDAQTCTLIVVALS